MKSMGAIGIVTGAHCDQNLENDRNRAFVKACSEAYGRNVGDPVKARARS